MKYKCLVCGRIYSGVGRLPIIQDADGAVGDGCCRVGSLVEISSSGSMELLLEEGRITKEEFKNYLHETTN